MTIEDVRPEGLERTASVKTTHGPVRGYRQDGLSIFKGVRYGAAPVGPLRFQPPATPHFDHGHCTRSNVTQGKPPSHMRNFPPTGLSLAL